MKLKKLSAFLEENPDLTILGLAWACYWRMIVTLFCVYMVIGMVMVFFVGLASL